VHVRAARLDDLPAVYRICDQNDPPAPGTVRSPELLGHVYAGPYVVWPGHRSRVVVDESGVVGYLLCAPDTAAFRAWVEAQWYPGLRADLPITTTRPASEQWIVELIHHPAWPHESVIEAYPAHLHIDLTERSRGRGLGTELIERLCAELAADGIPGVHLDVGLTNDAAQRLYRRLRFEELYRTDDSVYLGRVL
jgi:ribosomal protein S18 acetylase RimI-like enzyme